MQQLDPFDAAYFHLETPATPPQVVAVYVFDAGAADAGAITRESMTALFAPRVALIPALQHRIHAVPLSLDHPYWVRDENFDLPRHLLFHEMGGAGWEALRRKLISIAEAPLDLSRPPWQIHVLTGLRDVDGVADATVVVIRLHHVFGDGLASVEIARTLFTGEVHDASFAVAHADVGSGDPSSASLVWRAVRRAPRQIAELWRGVRGTAAASREATARSRAGSFVMPQAARPRTRFNHRPTRSRTFDAVRFTVSEVKAARAAAPGTTVNDVMLTTVSRALERYLDERHELPSESLAALVPMSTRGVVERSSVNQYDPLIVDLFTTEPDLRRRLAAISAAIRGDKARDLDDAVQRSRGLVRVLPALGVAALSVVSSRWPETGDTVSLSNTMITNVKRGEADLWLAGAPVVSSYGLPSPDEHTGLCHGIYSIGDRLTLCFVSDPAMLPDHERYAALLRESFDEVVRALDEPGERPAETAREPDSGSAASH